MRDVLDLDRYAIDNFQQPETQSLIAACKDQFAHHGMFNLQSFVRQSALVGILDGLKPVLGHEAYKHHRNHNVYFQDEISELAPAHPALTRFDTKNSTVCGDQIPDSLINKLYFWPPFIRFLAEVVGKPRLYPMADALARVNVMSYTDGECLNWHFDRSEFTTTLLLQQPEHGGRFEYRTDLRSSADPNYDGVARLLNGDDDQVRTLTLTPGTLNVFKGRNTAHRVSPVIGKKDRIVAVFSYYEQPDVSFSSEEQFGFYGRTDLSDGS